MSIRTNEDGFGFVLQLPVKMLNRKTDACNKPQSSCFFNMSASQLQLPEVSTLLQGSSGHISTPPYPNPPSLAHCFNIFAESSVSLIGNSAHSNETTRGRQLRLLNPRVHPDREERKHFLPANLPYALFLLPPVLLHWSCLQSKHLLCKESSFFKTA